MFPKLSGMLIDIFMDTHIVQFYNHMLSALNDLVHPFNNTTTLNFSSRYFSAVITTMAPFLFLLNYTYRTPLINGSELLKDQGFEVGWLWWDQVGLGGLSLIFLALAYITLLLIKKEK